MVDHSSLPARIQAIGCRDDDPEGHLGGEAQRDPDVGVADVQRPPGDRAFHAPTDDGHGAADVAQQCPRPGPGELVHQPRREDDHPAGHDDHDAQCRLLGDPLAVPDLGHARSDYRVEQGRHCGELRSDVGDRDDRAEDGEHAGQAGGGIPTGDPGVPQSADVVAGLAQDGNPDEQGQKDRDGVEHRDHEGGQQVVVDHVHERRLVVDREAGDVPGAPEHGAGQRPDEAPADLAIAVLTS